MHSCRRGSSYPDDTPGVTVACAAVEAALMMLDPRRGKGSWRFMSLQKHAYWFVLWVCAVLHGVLGPGSGFCHFRVNALLRAYACLALL